MNFEEFALVVIDVQRGFDDPLWGRRDNYHCETNIAHLIDRWRTSGGKVVFVRHESTERGSPLARGAPGNAFKEGVGVVCDLLVRKNAHSAFLGDPDLATWLLGQGQRGVAICGITTDHCCETTARAACDLGFEVLFISDATHTFDRRTPAGELVPAEVVHQVTEASLQGEFAHVVTTADLTQDRVVSMG